MCFLRLSRTEILTLITERAHGPAPGMVHGEVLGNRTILNGLFTNVPADGLAHGEILGTMTFRHGLLMHFTEGDLCLPENFHAQCPLPGDAEMTFINGLILPRRWVREHFQDILYALHDFLFPPCPVCNKFPCVLEDCTVLEILNAAAEAASQLHYENSLEDHPMLRERPTPRERKNLQDFVYKSFLHHYPSFASSPHPIPLCLHRETVRILGDHLCPPSSKDDFGLHDDLIYSVMKKFQDLD